MINMIDGDQKTERPAHSYPMRLAAYSLILAGGTLLGFVVQYRKFEKGNDDLLNWALLILAATFVIALFCVVRAWALILEHVFKRTPKSAQKGPLMPVATLLLLAVYPLCSFIPLETRFRAVIFSVAALALIMSVFDIARQWNGIGKTGLGTGLKTVLLLLLAAATLAAGNGLHNIQCNAAWSKGKDEPLQTPEKISLDKDVRPASPFYADTAFSWKTTLPQRPSMVFSLGVSEDLPELDDYAVEVRVKSPTKTEDFTFSLRSLFENPQETWREIILDLNDFGNQKADISLLTVKESKKKTSLGERLLNEYKVFVPAWNWQQEERVSLGHISRPRIIESPSARKDFNILLISIDTLTAKHLQFHGYPRRTAPNLEALANEGILFTNCFSPATWTLPAHMSLLTSLYPSAHRIHSREQKVKKLNFQTLAELLQDQGYYTAAFIDSGFVSSAYGFHQGFDTYFERMYWMPMKVDVVTQWFKEHKDLKFFLFLHTFEVHNYVNLRQEHKEYYASQYNGRITGHFQKLVLPQSEERVAFGLLPEDIDFVRDLYDGSIRHTDEHLGRLFQKMRELGVYDNTLIVVTADHGESFAEPHDNSRFTAWSHGNVPYESQIHVPLIVKMPKSFAAEPRTITTPYSLIDIMPTIAELLRVQPENRIQGISFAPVLIDGETRAVTRPLVSLQAPHHNLNTILSIRGDGFKYILKDYNSPKQREELYDLESDPSEEHNLAQENSLAERRSGYSKAMLEYLEECKAYKETHELGEEISEELRKELRALGYLE